jgi:hypothetical protein
MHSRTIDTLPGKAVLVGLAFCCVGQLERPALSQLAYQGIRQDVEFKVYIYAKESIGALRWRFQTKTVRYNPFTKQTAKPYYSDWRIADCAESTVDGQLVSAIARSGADVGEAEVLRTVCGYSR